jgi:hypothetical protein
VSGATDRVFALEATHLLRSQRDMVWPLTLKVGTGNFALTTSHDLPTLRFLTLGRRTDRAGGFFFFDQRLVQLPNAVIEKHADHVRGICSG